MIGRGKAALRLTGSGSSLRLRVRPAPDPLGTVRECCRASMALDKALGEAVRAAIKSGRSWAEVGAALGVDAETSDGVRVDYDASRRWLRGRLWGLEEGAP